MRVISGCNAAVVFPFQNRNKPLGNNKRDDCRCIHPIQEIIYKMKTVPTEAMLKIAE